MQIFLKPFFLILLFCANNVITKAQDADSSLWLHNIEEAEKLAGQYGKNIFVVFSGSDWCKPCMMFKKKILDSKEFVAFAEKNYVLVELDFPKLKKNLLPEVQQKYNYEQAKKYDREGVFPKVVILDKEGTELANTGYINMSPSKYVEHLKSLLDE